MRQIYNLLIVLAVIVMLPKFIKRLFKEPGFKERFKQSFGFIPATELAKVSRKNCVWIHAASVGEVVAASPIVREARKRFPNRPILFTVITATGYEMANRIITEADAITFLPLDLFWQSKRLVKQIQPAIFVNIETELWPNLLYYLKQQNIPAIMVNGRISEKSRRQYQWVRAFMKQTLSAIQKFCMQSAVDAQNIIEVGADPRLVLVTGNTKYEQSYTMINPALKAEKLTELRITGARPIFIAGSSYEGEEAALLKTFIQLKAQHAQAVMIIAPRKIARADVISELAGNLGIVTIKRTQITDQCRADVIILDTIGELGQLYGIADFVFVGGSLIKRGGHNILEPAAHGKPIVIGPNMFNFKEIYAMMSENQACITVHDEKELAETLLLLANDNQLCEKYSRNALKVIEENSGAVGRSIDEIAKLLIGR
ncbi:MAG: 3-deoxy-D-manno-octulosonic acid transferase [Bacillota bacterium]